MKRTIASLRLERLYRSAIDTFLAGTMPNFTREQPVHVANILRHLPYGRELMRLGLQTMAHRHDIPEKYRRTSPTRGGTASTAPSPTPVRLPTSPAPAAPRSNRQAQGPRRSLDIDPTIRRFAADIVDAGDHRPHGHLDGGRLSSIAPRSGSVRDGERRTIRATNWARA